MLCRATACKKHEEPLCLCFQSHDCSGDAWRGTSLDRRRRGDREQRVEVALTIATELAQSGCGVCSKVVCSHGNIGICLVRYRSTTAVGNA